MTMALHAVAFPTGKRAVPMGHGASVIVKVSLPIGTQAWQMNGKVTAESGGRVAGGTEIAPVPEWTHNDGECPGKAGSVPALSGGRK